MDVSQATADYASASLRVLRVTAYVFQEFIEQQRVLLVESSSRTILDEGGGEASSRVAVTDKVLSRAHPSPHTSVTARVQSTPPPPPPHAGLPRPSLQKYPSSVAAKRRLR